MLDLLFQKGLVIAPNAWNPERDKILKNTTAMLHVHQWRGVRTVAPLRYAMAAAYGMALIAEQVEARDIFDGVVLFCEYDAMPDYVATMTRRWQAELKERGQALHELLCGDYSFRNCVERAL